MDKQSSMERFWKDNQPEEGTSLACDIEPIRKNGRIVGFGVEPVDGTGRLELIPVVQT